MTTTQTHDWIPPGTFGPDELNEQLQLDLVDDKVLELPIDNSVRMSQVLCLTIELRFRKVL